MSGNEAEKAYLNLTFAVCAAPYLLLCVSCNCSPNCVQGKVSCVSVQELMIAKADFQFLYFPFGGDLLHIVLHDFHVFILTVVYFNVGLKCDVIVVVMDAGDFGMLSVYCQRRSLLV